MSSSCLPSFSNPHFSISSLWHTFAQDAPTQSVMRTCLCEAEKRVLTYCSKLCWTCSVCRRPTICLNTTLTTSSGWTRLVQSGGTENDVLQASRALWTLAVVYVLCTPAIKSFGFSASGLNRHFHMVLSIRSSSHHTFSWNCTITHLSYLYFSIWEIVKPLLRKKRSGGTQATPSAKMVSWAVHARVYHDVFSPFLL